MAELRSCDLCKAVRPRSAEWHFVTGGRAEPSEWRMAQHWCLTCMNTIKECLVAVDNNAVEVDKLSTTTPVGP